MSKFSMKAAAVVAVIGGMMASAVSASAALNLPTQSCSYMFNTNMRLGSRGTDVMNLQKVLNMYPQTQVASSGAGSPGMETSYFGAGTRAAVNKFHALHLVELGITAPTGNVFAGTRALLNEVCGGSTGGTSTGLPMGCTSSVGFSPVTGQSCGTSVPVTSTGPVSVMLAASQPSGMLVADQAGALLANLTFTGNGTVNSVELQRVGVSSDSSLTNVYLYDGNVRITDAASVVTGGYIRFNASNGLFTVSGSRTISVRADIAGSTNGQSVGVKLNSVTAMGSAASSYSNVMGNVLLIGSATPASANFSAISNSSSVTVDAGTSNYKVWDGTVSIGTRDVNLRSATFKFVGSAPTDAIQNLSLYVDGVKVAGPSMVNAANNNKVSFDLGSVPFLMKTGSHTMDVRGDIVKGSNRTFVFSIENVADLMFEDTSLAGVNVAAKVGGLPLTQTNTSYNSTILISKGNVTASVDPSFNATKVTGGATNVPVGQFTLKAYGEDVKVNTLQVTPSLGSALPYAGGLPNVSLYVNGAQVGTSQNWTSGALSYNLGSSLIIPAGQTVTLTVKADVVNATSSAAYTGGTLSVSIGGVASNAQGQSSNELITVAASALPGNTLTVSSGAGTFARTAGFTAGTVAPNTLAVKLGSFTLQANSSESLRVTSVGVNPNVSGYAITNLSNLTLKTGSTVLGTPVGNPASGTSTFSFNEVIISANGTMVFDVYGDVGSAVTGSSTLAMDITYRGSTSNTTVVGTASGATLTTAVASLNAATLVSSSETTQAVVGGSTFGIASFKLSTAAAGTQATVRELRFSTVGTDAIESITVGGVTAPVVSGTSTVTGLNINISSVGTDVPVTVKYSGFLNSSTGGSLQSSVASTSVTLTYVEATSGSGSVVTEGSAVASRVMSLVASKPTVSMSAGGTNDLVLGNVETKVAEFTVTADQNGRISIATTSLSLSTSNVVAPEITNARIADGNTTIADATVSGSSTIVVGFSPAYEISAGQSKTFSVYAKIAGTQNGTNKMYVTSQFTSPYTFQWRDVIGGNTLFDGGIIKNFPTSGYTTRQ
ncbi:MAG: hypothetical protein QG653_526 [Patescibacteria group bacterium]|nr:hypothetical protein [Patescibacteria group bacterium]